MEKINDILNKFGVKNTATAEDLFKLFCELDIKENKDLLNELIFPGSPLVSFFDPRWKITALHVVLNKTLRGSELVEKLVHCGANVNAQNSYDETPLHIVMDIITLFYPGKNPYPFLKKSKFNKNTEVIKTLIKNKANIHICDNEGLSVLHRALSLGNLEVMEILLENYKLPNIVKRRVRNYAKIEKTTRCRHVVMHLLKEWEKCIVPTSKFSPLLEFIARQKNLELDDLFEYVVKNTTFNVNAISPVNDTLLHIVSAHGTPGMIDTLIAAGADTNIYSKNRLVIQTPIFSAILYSKPKNVKSLVENGANVNIIEQYGHDLVALEANTPLHYAVSLGDFEITQILVENGANVNALTFHRSPLLIACGSINSYKWGALDFSHLVCAFSRPKYFHNTIPPYVYDVKIVKFLLDNGADIEAKNPRKRTALDQSCKFGNLNIVKLLLNRGAKIKKRGFTTLHYAITGKNPDIVRLILEKGVNVNYVCTRMGTPLQYAIKEIDQNCAEIVKILLTYDAKVNLPDKRMNSPLHLACLSDKSFKRIMKRTFGKAAIITELLNSNADINAYNRNGKTPFFYVYLNYVIMYKIGNGDSNNPYKLDLETLVCFLIEMKARKEYLCEQNLFLLEDDAIIEMSEKYQDEINRMKEKVVNSRHISYFNILSMDINYLGEFLRNYDVMEVLNSLEYKIRFPYYGAKLEKKIQDAQQRQSLTDVVVNLFLKHMKVFLPFEVIIQILIDLSLKDLNNFAEACFFKVGSV